MDQHADIVVIGAGAAGLMCAIHAGAGGGQRVVLVDGARKLGAKILVAGGGRCNVTHDTVTEHDFAGSTPAAIRKVLRRFTVEDTIRFFRERGVELKREETGKLFPVTDRAQTILNALLGAARKHGVEIHHPWRVERVIKDERGFAVHGPRKAIAAGRVVLATGGRSLPKTGSDGHGYDIATSLGHSVTERIFPALVPLKLEIGHFLTMLSGIAAEVLLEVRSHSGRRLAAFRGSLLCTHFGISGPVVLDISRFLINSRMDDPEATLLVNWLPGMDFSSVDTSLQRPGRESIARWLGERLPRRLAEALCRSAAIEPGSPRSAMPRERRRALAHLLVEMELPVTGDRGFTFAEVTAGGVPLSELNLATMESRICPGLFLCGEICDIDGRIGGFNFQWAWASGYVAGAAIQQARIQPV